MTDKALRLAELEGMLAKATERPWDRRGHPKYGCTVWSGETRINDGTEVNAWNDFGLIVAAVNALPDLLSLIRAQQEQITELAPRAAMLSAVHGALMDAGFAMGDIGQSEVEMVRTLAESNATWERKSDEAHAQIRAQQEEIERLRTICTGTARAVLATPSRVLFCDNCEWDEGDGELFQCPSCIARQYDADEGAALTEEK
jgi:hypothetical protein